MARKNWTRAAAGLFGAAGLAMAVAGSAVAVEDFDPETASPMCGPGTVYDSMLQFCTEAKAGAVSDRMFYEYAYVLGRFERYDEAIALLDLIAEPNTAPVLNIRGFVTRKQGKFEEAVGYYLKALELDPDYSNAREYLGEAYVGQGKLDLAREQLAEIETRCGNTCTQFVSLAAVIKAAE